MPRRLEVRIEKWPIAGAFAISRGAKTEATVVVAELREGDIAGRGECVPYARYGESPDGVFDVLTRLKDAVAVGMSRADLHVLLPAGAARNALDCALWDFEAKQSGRRCYELAGLPAPVPAETAYTLSLDTPERMAEAARAAARQILKIKLGADGDIARLKAVRAAAPNAELIVDANEGWTPGNLAENLRACADAGVALIEQPLPADNDEALRSIDRIVPVCADESFHDSASFGAIAGKYDAVNIKLDKTGGLTEALRVLDEAKQRGLDVMAGCMVATSLAMAPAMLLAPRAAYVDLDGPLLLAKDREHGLRYDGARIFPPAPELWG